MKMRELFRKDTGVCRNLRLMEIMYVNPWINDIDFNNVDTIKCKEIELYWLIRLAIENNVIKCNVLIDDIGCKWLYNYNTDYTHVIVFDKAIPRIEYDDSDFNSLKLLNIKLFRKEDLIITYNKSN